VEADTRSTGSGEVRFLAHRGSSARYPEHTRAAFQQAIAEGADGIECDVRLTADGAVVCWHDRDVDRTTTATGRIADWRLAGLEDLDLLTGQVIPQTHGDPRRQLMTLTALLELMRAAGRRLILVIELKPSARPDTALVQAVLATLDAAGWNRESGVVDQVQIGLQCFDVATSEALLEAVPAELVMLLVEPTAEHPQDAALAILDAGTMNAGPWVEWLRQEPDRVGAWIARGSLVRVWTVDTLDDLDACLAIGVQQITSNRPAELRAEFDARRLQSA
jgi:glycerophosphoryl diester phosphodiesterase